MAERLTIEGASFAVVCADRESPEHDHILSLHRGRKSAETAAAKATKGWLVATAKPIGDVRARGVTPNILP